MAVFPDISLPEVIPGDAKLSHDAHNNLNDTDIIRNAHRIGYIELAHLPRLMAKEDLYNDLIPGLLKKFQCDYKGFRNQDEIKSYENTREAWEDLFNRWVFGSDRDEKAGGFSAPYLPIYHFNRERGVYERGYVNGEAAMVSLQVLGEYLLRTVGIYLPSSLFPGRDMTIPAETLMKSWKIDSGILIQYLISVRLAEK